MAPTRVTMLTVLAVVSVLLSACTPTPQAAAPGTTVSGSGDSAGIDEDGRTAVLAITAAEANAGGRAFELERDDDRWEVHVAVGDREVEVRVASDGTTVEASSDDDGIDAEARAAPDAAVTTLADAVRIATTENPGSERLDEVQLEDESGTWIWKVELSGGTTVRVSAADGTVL